MKDEDDTQRLTSHEQRLRRTGDDGSSTHHASVLRPAAAACFRSDSASPAICSASVNEVAHIWRRACSFCANSTVMQVVYCVGGAPVWPTVAVAAADLNR